MLRLSGLNKGIVLISNCLEIINLIKSLNIKKIFVKYSWSSSNTVPCIKFIQSLSEFCLILLLASLCIKFRYGVFIH